MLHVLFIPACPLGMDELNLKEEICNLQNHLQNNQVFLSICSPTYASIQRELAQNQFSCIHYSGHGDIGGYIYLEEENWRQDQRTPESFAELLKNHSIKLAIMLCCHSEVLAHKLSQNGIGSVIGTFGSCKISDQASVEFSDFFYQKLSIGESPFTENTDRVGRVCFNADNTLLASSSYSNEIIVWNIETKKIATKLLPPARIFDVIFNGDTSSEIIVACNTLCAFDVEQLEIPAHSDQIQSLDYNHDGSQIASIASNGELIIWDCEKALPIQSIVLGKQNNTNAVTKKYSKPLCSVDFSYNGQLVVAAYKQNIIVLNVTTNEVLPLPEHPTDISFVTFDETAHLFAYGDIDGNIYIWDLKNKKNHLKIPAHKDTVRGLDFTQDSKMLLSVSEDKDIKIWDILDGKEVYTSSQKEKIMHACFSKNEKIIALSLVDNTARFWDIANNKETKVFNGHTTRVCSLDFSPDAKLLTTGSTDGTAKIWDIETQKCLYTLNLHKDIVYDVCYSPDGKHIATSSIDTSIIIWDAKIGKAIKQFTKTPENRLWRMYTPRKNPKTYPIPDWILSFTSEKEITKMQNQSSIFDFRDDIPGWLIEKTLSKEPAFITQNLFSMVCTEALLLEPYYSGE